MPTWSMPADLDDVLDVIDDVWTVAGRVVGFSFRHCAQRLLELASSSGYFFRSSRTTSNICLRRPGRLRDEEARSRS